MSTPLPPEPPGDSSRGHGEPGDPEHEAGQAPASYGPQPFEPEPSGPDGSDHVPVSPPLPDDPPKVGDFWVDARLSAAPAGVAYIGHDDRGRVAMVILLSEGAAADPAARDRLAGLVNRMHIDDVYARGGQGQDFGRLGRKFRSETDDPVTPDERPLAPWVALAYDGSPATAARADNILDEVQLDTLAPLGDPAGPDNRHYWIDRVQPGLTRLWPLPWPGRYDRAGWQTILVSWLLMLLLATLAVLIAILVFHNQPPQTPPPPTGGSASPPPQSSSPSPQSGSPSPQSGSPSPSSGSPSATPSRSASPSSPSGSPSPRSASPRSPSPSGSQSGGAGTPEPSQSASAGGSSPGSRL